MKAEEPATAPPSERAPVTRLQLNPTFLGALQGIWLLTWKSHAAWRRVPLRVIGLLVLPLLVVITLSHREDWNRRHLLLGNPHWIANEFVEQIQGTEFKLQPEQETALRELFIAEFARAEQQRRDTQSPQTTVDELNEQVRACYQRIRDGARQILDERQFARFQEFSRRKTASLQARSGEPQWNWTAPFYHWLISLYFFMILPLSCIRASGALIRDELQADTLGFLTTRPVKRAGLVLAKYLSQIVLLQGLLLVETLLLFAAGSVRGVPALGALLPLFLGTQFLAVLAWSALGLFLGQVTKRYLALALVYGVIVEMGIGRIPTNINNLSLMRHLKSLLAHNAAVQSIFEWPLQNVPLSIGALAVTSAVFVGLAALLFTLLEYHHTTEMQK